MPMQQYAAVVIDSSGAPVPGTSVTVKYKASGLPATIYSDEVGTTKTNPTQTDGNGQFWFYAPDGDYILEAASGFTLSDVTLFAGAAREQHVRKASAETVTSSTALQDDDHLVFAAGANETWEFQLHAYLTSPLAAGFKYAFAVPAAAVWSVKFAWLWDESGPTCRHIDRNDLTVAASYPGAVAALSSDVLSILGSIATGATAGNVQFRWAQATSDPGDTQVLAGSILNARKLT